VLLGAEPPVEVSQRGQACLVRLHEERGATVDPGGPVLDRAAGRFWTYAGDKANRSLLAALGLDGVLDSLGIDVPESVGVAEIRGAAESLGEASAPGQWSMLTCCAG
jgi:ATP-dependent Lhr-like helicase